MSYYHLLIEKGCSLKQKNRQLEYKTNDRVLSIPIEDISVLLIESIEVSITSNLLFSLAEAGVSVILLNDQHSPVGELLPLNNHSRSLKSIEAQLFLTLPFKKRLWKVIIENKIKNQSILLSSRKGEDFGLKTLAKRVSPGDIENIEARAALIYFRNLLSDNLLRRVDSVENTILNYGYAILRSKISQELSAYGFLDSLGVHHKSDTNRFNLSYDLIEPFRVFSDLKMIEIMSRKNPSKLNTEVKQEIISLIESRCLIGGSIYTVHTGIKRYVKSYAESVYAKDFNKLVSVEVFIE